MATRGRKPAPIELKLLRGNPGKRAINAKASVLQQAEALAGDATPGMLLEEAKPYWEHAIAHAPRGLLRKLDVYLLAAWCNAARVHDLAQKTTPCAMLTIPGSESRVDQRAEASSSNAQREIFSKRAPSWRRAFWVS